MTSKHLRVSDTRAKLRDVGLLFIFKVTVYSSWPVVFIVCISKHIDVLQQLVALENTERIVQTTADIVLTMNPAIDLMGDVMIVRLDIMVLNVIKVCCFLLLFG